MKGRKNKQDMTALMCAAKYGRLDVVVFLLEAESRIVTNTTALLLAVQSQNYAVAKYLAPLEFDVTPSDGRTALMVAASDCDTVFVTLLLEYLGNENDLYWKTALEYAVLGSKMRNLQTLIESEKFTSKQIQTAYYYSLTVTDDTELRSYLKEEARNRGASISNTESTATSLNASMNDECVDMLHADLDRLITVNTEQEKMIEELQTRILHFQEQEDKLKTTIAGEYDRSQDTDFIIQRIQQELDKLSQPLLSHINSVTTLDAVPTIVQHLVSITNNFSTTYNTVRDQLRDFKYIIENLFADIKQDALLVISEAEEGMVTLSKLKSSTKHRLTDVKYQQRINSLEEALELTRKTIDELRANNDSVSQKPTCDKGIYVWLPIQHPPLVRPSIEPIVTSLAQSLHNISSRASRGRNSSVYRGQQPSHKSMSASTTPAERGTTEKGRASAPLGRDSVSERRDPLEGVALSSQIVTASRMKLLSPVSPKDITLRASVEHVPNLLQETSTSSVPVISASPRQSVGASALDSLLVDENGVTTLMTAALEGNVAGVRASITQAKKRNNEGLTALMLLAQQKPFTAGHLEALKVLLTIEGGMFIPSGKQAGATALMLALSEKNFSAAEVLIDVDAGHQKDNGITALLLATFHGHDNLALRLIDTEGKLFKSGAQTPLMNAASHGSVEVVKKLLFQAKCVKPGGWTALMIASQKGHAAVVDLLAPHEAGMQKDDGTTALLLAANGGFLEIARILAPKEAGILHSKGHSALLLAARSNYYEIVKLLLSKEAGIPARNTVTALMYASQKGHVETVKLLLEYEAGKMSEDQWTALMYAALNNQSAVVKILAPKEANMRRDKYTGATAMIIAAEHGAVESVAALLDYEAGCTDKVGCTALMVAAQRGHTAVVELLRDKESGIQTPEGITALMLAIQYSHRDCIRLLYKNECRLKTADGNSCSYYCVNSDDLLFLQSLSAQK